MTSQLDLLPGVPEGFRCLLMDPPWALRGAGRWRCSPERHYPLLNTKDIPGVILGSGLWRPHREASHLWMWATDNFLPDALWLMGELGHRYIRTFVWVKMRGPTLQIGLGQYGRGAHELLLFGVRGKAMVPPAAVRRPSVFFAERTRHSQKPEAAFELIEAVTPGPRVEFFARKARQGWAAWGNEIEEVQP